MISLFRLFLDIATWRRGPQDLPGSPTLFWLCAVVYLAVGFVQVRLLRYPFVSAGLLIALDFVLLAGAIALILSLQNKRERWLQTMAALLGVGTLLGLLDIAMHVAMRGVGSTEESVLWLLVKLAFILLVFGRILQQALETRLLIGVALTYAIVIVQSAALLLVPGPPTVATGD